MMVPRRALSVVLLVVALAASSCATRAVRPIELKPPAPIPNSPGNALRLFEWCYDYHSIPMYRTLFTADYHFFFSAVDSAGAEYRGIPWTRADEIVYFTHLVAGGAGAYPADSISLRLDHEFIVVPDVRYPWDVNGRWHKSIRTEFLLSVRTTDGNAFAIPGAANFCFVRGDSASIPSDLAAGPDSTRWYIQRWDDETFPPFRTQAVDGPYVSWGSIKALYRRFAPD